MILLCCLISYLIGALPFGLLVGLLWKRVDIRTLGSKNIGATNVLRVLGPGPGLTVFALDTLKGVAGVLLARKLLGQEFSPVAPMLMPALIIIGFCAVLGHSFSLFLRFRGGKGVATSLGMLLALAPFTAVVAFVLWLAIVAITRYVSLAAIIAAVSVPVTAYFDPYLPSIDRWWMVGLSVLLALLVLVKHRSNMQRLLQGTEAKIGQRVSARPDAAGAH
jgi:glycerol-3-phosphate acyltransferase PlsY